MKSLGFTINIDNNSNVAVSHSEANWSALRNGDLVLIGDNKNFYNIDHKEEIFFIQSFKSISSNKILINGNYENFFLPDDIIDISYKEYELLTIKQMINKGNGYQVGDILTLDGGLLSLNIETNTSQSTLFEVEQIDSNGGIEKLKVANKGVYLSFPSKTNKLKSGHGANAEVSIEEKVIESRKIVERQIEDIKNVNSDTVLTLNYPLPMIEGKVSVTKWKAFLTSNYNGENQRDARYEVVRNYTPNIRLPLVVKNTDKLEEAFNYALQIVDKEIQSLREEINNLKDKS